MDLNAPTLSRFSLNGALTADLVHLLLNSSKQEKGRLVNISLIADLPHDNTFDKPNLMQSTPVELSVVKNSSEILTSGGRIATPNL